MIGLPMLSGFVGEFLILSSTFGGVSRGWAIAAPLGVILGAAYMLWLVQRSSTARKSELVASKPGRRSALPRTGRALAAGRADAGHGTGAFASGSSHRRRAPSARQIPQSRPEPIRSTLR
jgi:hypothetical protein